MSQGFPVGCPHCGTQFVLPAPPMYGQTFVCQRCGQPFQPPAMAPMMPGFAPNRRKQTNWLLPATLGAGAVALLLVVGLIVLLWTRDRPSAVADVGGGSAATTPMDSAATPNTAAVPAPPASGGGLADAIQQAAQGASPDGIVAELKLQIEALNATMATIRDVPSRDAAIARMVEVNAALEALVLRGARLEPLSDAEFKAFQQRHKADPPKSVGGGSANPGLANEALEHVALRTQRNAGAIQGVLTNGLRPLPPPRNDAEQVEHDSIVISRSATRALARITAPADIAAAVAALGDAIKRTNELVAKKQALPNESLALQAKTTYLEFSVQPEMLLSDLHRMIVDRHGDDPALAQALVDFSTARSNLSFARAGAATVAGGAPAVAPGAGQPPLSPPSPGGLPLGVQVFIRQFGKDSVLVVHCGKPTEARATELETLIARIAPGALLNHRENDYTYIAVKYDGDVTAFAQQINFARVTSVNMTDRVITIEP